MRCELAVFDVAGTTIKDADFVASSFQEALKSKGIEAELTEFQGLMGFPKPLAIHRFMEQRGLPHLREDQADIHAQFEESMVNFYRSDARVEALPGAEEAFELLHKAGIKVALNTGFNRRILDAILDRLSWKAKVDYTIASDEVTHGRPAPDMIHKAMSHLGVASGDRVAKVGDTPNDMQEGTAAGCRWIVGVTCGTHTAEQLEQTPHTHIADGPLEAARLILT